MSVLFTGSLMEYIGNVSDLPRKPGKLRDALSSITGYKVYMQKPTAFLVLPLNNWESNFKKKKAQYHLE